MTAEDITVISVLFMMGHGDLIFYCQDSSARPCRGDYRVSISATGRAMAVTCKNHDGLYLHYPVEINSVSDL